MTEERFNQNQTQFASEQPLVQPLPDSGSTPEPPAAGVPVTPAALTRKKLPRWAWWAIGVTGVIAISVVVTLLRLPRQTPQTSQDGTPTVIERELTPLELRLETAKQLLEDANPTVQGLPFPPIDTLLRIDKTR